MPEPAGITPVSPALASPCASRYYCNAYGIPKRPWKEWAQTWGLE
jgi:hypothetical protein